jgi:lipoprotein NlpD
MLELNFGWPIKGRVLKSFSPPRNKGIDIAGKQGQSIKATEAGKVVYGGHGLIGFGKLLIIKHNNDYLSAYANNSRLLVNEGQHVQKGQVIAEVGNVGIKRTSLHFEIRKNGKPVNPLKLLPKK